MVESDTIGWMLLGVPPFVDPSIRGPWNGSELARIIIIIIIIIITVYIYIYTHISHLVG